MFILELPINIKCTTLPIVELKRDLVAVYPGNHTAHVKPYHCGIKKTLPVLSELPEHRSCRALPLWN